MNEAKYFKPNEMRVISTGSANYSATTTAVNSVWTQPIVISGDCPENFLVMDMGKYSIFEVANWFLSKSEMTHKKLQKLCYYAQAWNYAIRGDRLIDSDFQAWVHGPVSPALYERFKEFGSDAIKLVGEYECKIKEEDIAFLEDIWETYGDLTGNALEALSHRELPWILARNGYTPDERCSVVISPESMASYYKSIRTNN